MPRRSLKVKETELREERITWLWNRRGGGGVTLPARGRATGVRPEAGPQRQGEERGRLRQLEADGGPSRLIGDVVKGEERVSSEGEVASRRAELFEKATMVFDPGRSSKTRFDNGESKLI
jgi:hypothetical protein